MSEQLRKWIADYDSGKEMKSVSMGGISQGYEQAIQDCAIEIMRTLSMIKIPEDKDTFNSLVGIAADSAVELLDKKHGFSGAQVGAAKNLAAVFWRQSPEKGIEMMEQENPERIIPIFKGDHGMVVCASKG